jgi:hypothetical protein
MAGLDFNSPIDPQAFLAQLMNLRSGSPGAGDNSQFGGNMTDILGSLSAGGAPNANGSGLGFNLPTLTAGIQGLGQLGGLYLGLRQLSLAKDSFKLQKEAYNTNLRNSTQSYNTQVGDRIAGRSYATEEERQAALRAAQLPTPGA